MSLAKIIASKSPVAIWTLKRNLHFHKDASIERGLDHIKLLNGSNLMTEVKTAFPKILALKNFLVAGHA
jgi:hypothetical protein